MAARRRARPTAVRGCRDLTPYGQGVMILHAREKQDGCAANLRVRWYDGRALTLLSFGS